MSGGWRLGLGWIHFKISILVNLYGSDQFDLAAARQWGGGGCERTLRLINAKGRCAIGIEEKL